MDIKYRTLCKKDFKQIKHLISEAWFSGYDLPKKYKVMYADAYINYYLGNSNYTEVALDNDKIIGFIFAKAKKVSFFHKLKYNFKLFLLLFKFFFSKAGRYGLFVIKREIQVNKKLIKPLKKELHNEINLIITDSSYRGHGIGSKLESNFTEFLKNNNEHHIYLYTDTYSNYKFYFPLGYKKIAEEKAPKEFGDDENSAYFIFKKEF